MKIDDDTIFDLPRWEFWTDNRFKKQLDEAKGLAFFGYEYTEVIPVREPKHKWFVLNNISEYFLIHQNISIPL